MKNARTHLNFEEKVSLGKNIKLITTESGHYDISLSKLLPADGNSIVANIE